MVVVVVMMVMVVPMRPHHDHRAVPVMMMVVVMVAHLHDLSVGWLSALLAVHRLQDDAGIRDRLQQIGIGVCAQRVGRHLHRCSLR